MARPLAAFGLVLGVLAGHWLLGLPIGYGLCFWWGWGVVGLWVGLSTGLIVIGCVLLMAWRHQIRRIAWDLAGPMR